jgi:lysine-specific demethylase 3
MLQDWPPSALFQATPPFCDLHVDLMSATPVPGFTRSDGRFNVASYTPKGDAKSDLGNTFEYRYLMG